MKKKLLLLLRILVAMAGLSFIAFSVTWRDHVVMPIGAVLPDGSALTKKQDCRVLQGGPEEHDGGTVVFEVRGASGSVGPMTLRSEELGLREHEPHFVPGVLRMLREANLPLLALAVAMVGMIYPIQIVRWWLLLRVRGIHIQLWMAAKLTMVGCFFNYCMPGSTGGDLVKAFYAAKRKEGRADAVMTVFMDRVVGLFGLILLAGLAGLMMLSNPVARQVTMYVWLGIVSVAIGSMVYFSQRLRQIFRVEQILARLPGKALFTAVDQSMVSYRRHVGVVSTTLGMSLVVHLLLSSATAVSGYALGMQASFGLLLTVLPVLFLASALPFFYQGLGVMEWLAMPMLLNPPATSANHIVGMLLLIRMYQVLYSLTGAVFVIRGNVHMLSDAEKAEIPEAAPTAPAAPATGGA